MYLLRGFTAVWQCVSGTAESGQLVTALCCCCCCLSIDCPAFHGGQRAGSASRSVSASLLSEAHGLPNPRYEVDANLQGECRIAGLVVVDSRGLCIQAQVRDDCQLWSQHKTSRALASQSQLGCSLQWLPKQLSLNLESGPWSLLRRKTSEFSTVA